MRTKKTYTESDDEVIPVDVDTEDEYVDGIGPIDTDSEEEYKEIEEDESPESEPEPESELDEDAEDLDIVPVPPPKTKKRVSRPAIKEETPPPQPAPKRAPKKATAPPKPKYVAPTDGSVRSLEEVLAGIPDAMLPDVDPNVKFNFKDFMNRGGANASSEMSQDIVVPVAREDCLAGMKIVFTGVLPHLSRDESNSIAKRYGAEVMKSLSRKTTLVVIGADAGPAKVRKIKELGTKVIDEEGFLQLLRDMPTAGGSGELAQKAMQKKIEMEQKIEEEAQKMQEEFEEKQKKLQKTNVMAALNNDSKTKLSSPSEFVESDLWTTKYAPTDLTQIIGNPGAVKKLSNWLASWKKSFKYNFKKPGPDGSGGYRAVIIHGPPGIGKTTAAHLVAKLQGFDVLENNASDTRSKSLLSSKVTSTIKNTSLNGYFAGDGKQAEESKKNLVLIMDEVDGMSGGDRGGVGQMAALCRETSIPIILICNDRSLPKMRPFDRVAFDIPFRRPDANAARVRIMSIARNEHLNLEPGVVDQLIASTHADIRQILNVLSTFARTRDSMGSTESTEVGKAWEKHTVLKPFDIVARLLSGATFAPSSRMTLNDKTDLYFHDHDFTPLMVQENYLNMIPAKSGNNKQQHLELVLKAAESIADGDLVDARIHSSEQQWSLMPLHAVMSSVRPASFVAGQAKGRYNFTSYLGNNSKRGKYDRLLQELHSHMRLEISGNKIEVREDYLVMLVSKLLLPLVKNQSDGIPDVIEFMDDYYITREDWDVIMELSVAPPGMKRVEDIMKSIPTAVKSSFTRKYNATSHLVPFMKSAASLKGAPSAAAVIPDIAETLGEEIEKDDDEEQKQGDDDDISKDKYIKVSKPKKKQPAKSKATKAKGGRKSAKK